MSEMAAPWLRFKIGETAFAIPLRAVAEVTSAATPRLIPLVPLQVGGILNVRGEPLPAVDGGVLLCNQPSGTRRHVLVLEHETARIGVLVGHVSRIERSVPSSPADEELDADCMHLRWVIDRDERLGLVDPEALLERAAGLLTGQRSQMGEGPCQSAF
jgi:chemotaxis signal transduction protein